MLKSKDQKPRFSQAHERVRQSILSARWAGAAKAIERLAEARSLDEVVDLLRRSCRRIVGADGITIVLRDGEMCHYIAEDSEAPLWQGQRFPAEHCISGWAMRTGETVAIPDIRLDPRVPQDAYAATFVRSMLMVPIGEEQPVAAIGAYWSETGAPSDNETDLMEAIARAASTALAHGRTLAAMERLNANLETRVAERTAELERAYESLRQTKKMEMIGQLTGNVAHDFNNLLSPIMASLDLILGGRASPEAQRQNAAIAMEAAESAKSLIQRLLAFARRQPLITSDVDAGMLIKGMRSLLSSTIGERSRLELRVTNNLPAIRVDRQQLEMAILNLTVNARDAMPDGGTIIITVEMGEGQRPERLGPGSYIRLSVEDNGTGMDARTLAAATEPFFTTKAAGNGTGLGLSMVEGVASQLGGAIEMESEPGQGTKVSLWLPAARKAPVKAAAPERQAQPVDCKGRLLLIDDDALVRAGTEAMLSDLGYDVTAVDEARIGLDMIEEGFAPDILVTDHVMPGMTGAELALRVRTDHPGVAIVIVSGYQGIDLIAPDIVRLSKPFRQGHLSASIAAAQAQVHQVGA